MHLCEKNVIRCGDIIDELLDFSRVRELKLQTTLIDTWLLITIGEMNIPQTVTMRHKMNAGVDVQIDRELFRRVIVNVLTNALQAIEAKEKDPQEITITTAVKESSVFVSINDTGVGVDDATLAKVFEPMFSTKNFGVGLGLPIVKNIVDQHGGCVTIESTLGKKTTVTIQIPIQQA